MIGRLSFVTICTSLLVLIVILTDHGFTVALPKQSGDCDRPTIPTNDNAFIENSSGINFEEGLSPETEPNDEKIPGSEPEPCINGQPKEPNTPILITGLRVVGTTSTGVNLIWDSNNDPDFHHYNVYRGSNSGFVIIPGVTPPVGSSSVKTFSDSGLKPFTTYFYKVAGVKLVGTYSEGTIGPLSSEIVAKTKTPGQELLGGTIGSLPSKNFNPQKSK
jgi:hypothetical protein